MWTLLKTALGSRWLIYGAPVLLLALAGTHAYAYRAGVSRESDRQASAQLKSVAQALKTRDALQVRVNTIAAGEVAAAAGRRVIYRTITREVTRHAASTPAVQCLDADGLRILRAAAGGVAPEHPVQPHPAVR